MKKNIIIILSVVVAAILIKYMSSSIMDFFANRAMKNKPAPAVQVAEVQAAEVLQTFDAPGRITSKYQVAVLARIKGYLQQSYFKEGDYVKKGQVLFRIEPEEYINSSNIAKGNLDNTKAELVYAEKQLIRARELVKKDYIAKARYDEILSRRDALRAKLHSMQATYSDTQRNYGYTFVKSPVNGKVGIINVTVGNYVGADMEPLTTIYSNDPIYVTFPLDSKDFNNLTVADSGNNQNRKVELYFNNGTKYKFDGVQDFQDNKIDQTTGTVTLRATFKNPENQLIHGDFVNIKLYSNNKVKVPVVPLIAVQENQAGKYVYKIDENNIPKLTYIKVSNQHDNCWIITEGVNIGEKIIVDGLQKVIPGKPVKPVTAEEMAKIKIKDVQKGN